MATKGRLILTLGVVSAILASLVPGVFEPAASARSAVPVIALETAPPAELVMPARLEPAPDMSPKAVPAPRMPEIGADRRRIVVPLGCERVVSPLVRSAATATIGRCIT